MEFTNKNNGYNNNESNDEKDGIGEENLVKYGEFVSSYFSWLPLEEQKDKADKLKSITKKNKK